MAPLRVTHGPRTGPVGYEKHWRFPCRARMMPVRAPHGVPVESYELFNQTISVQTCQVVRTGPVAWCDHGNSTDVKFLRVLHSVLRARNRTGDKNRTGPVVGCDWGMRHYPGLILGLRSANERRRYKVHNAVSHWLGANLESALNTISFGWTPTCAPGGLFVGVGGVSGTAPQLFTPVLEVLSHCRVQRVWRHRQRFLKGMITLWNSPTFRSSGALCWESACQIPSAKGQ